MIKSFKAKDKYNKAQVSSITFFKFFIPFSIFNKSHKESLSDIKINNRIITNDSKNIWIWIINCLLLAFISVIIEMP